ncbi:MAG TPA: M28 family peptidase [Planctomycetes bacterium]|nr:M28 family peptidase [Planctomycetota bacterium]HIK59577.1 M28 family peptidase [Planctomycetota bacterium]
MSQNAPRPLLPRIGIDVRAPLACLLACWVIGSASGAQDPPAGALGKIGEKAVQAHVNFLASPELEGRDSPSVGQSLAAEYICETFRSCGFVAAGDSGDVWKRVAKDRDLPPWSAQGDGGTYLRPFLVEVDTGSRRGTPRTRPDGKNAELVLVVDGVEQAFALGQDFVPVPRCGGEVGAELVFAGFGIQAKKEGYDDFKGVDLEGKVALIIEGEPNHKRRFNGAEVTALASIWNKIAALQKEGAAGVLIMRRPYPKRKSKDGEGPPAAPLSYRYTYASFNPPDTDRWRDAPLPALEISAECAQALTGKDIAELAERMDRSGKPSRLRLRDRVVVMNSATEESDLLLNNIVALLPGSDPELAEEVVIVGAHYDHIGVGKRGRVGLGADDNGSGSAALLQVAAAFKGTTPRRSILFASFTAEEDGLVGSAKLAANLPIPREQVVAMVNMDMLGVGEASEVVCFGFKQNPGLEKIVTRANRLGRTGVRRITEVNDPGVFQRSDHYSFHSIGIPAVFFTEGFPIEKNKDYHTWRDTPDSIDAKKIAASARLAFLTTWILANQDDRLPSPRD